VFARVTLFDIDAMRASIPQALERFKEFVLPELRKQPGYSGVYALPTPEGRGLLLTLWASEEDAQAGVASGFYSQQVQKFISLYRAPPGREHYEVTFVELPAAVH
jgi:heme-degrading monooxygenase HmoA